ncbi:MAG: AAA family ATPase, partial [Actinomycetota bacterium]|nr:AAA family ATPase [Actinomycetota bacterium]
MRQALKTVTVLFTDMVDSTALGERFDPESLHRVMQEYFRAIRSVIETYGGSVEKFIGDAVMAVFGVPALHEDDAIRAVVAAVALHQAVGEVSARLEREAGVSIEIRTGINTGQVLAEMSGDPVGGLVGDVLNVAARLQQAAEPGQILIGPETQLLTKDLVRSEPLTPLSVKGRTGTVAAHRLIEVLPGEGARPRRLQTPIVGRDREVQLLQQTLDRVLEDRTPHLFTILGAPGVGKSRLVAELVAGSHDDALVLGGRCLPYGEGITFWPLIEIVQQAAGITSDDAPEDARAKIAASVAGHGATPAAEQDDLPAVAERVAQVVGLPGAGGTTEELFWAVRKYLEALARQRPLLLVLDDVHWAEPAMLDLIDHLGDSAGEVPLLIVCMARLELLELRSTWGGGKMNSSSLVLGPLKEDDCRTLVSTLLDESVAADEIAAAVFRVADGNPLFVEETVAMLVDDGLLKQDDGRWTAAQELSTVSVPPTIQALVSARLDRLSGDEREVVGMAAVMGKVFVSRAVADLASPAVGARVEDVLGRLTRKQLVAPEEAEFAGSPEYSFRHLLIRDTAYEHLPRLTRAAIHERYADWLVDVLGERLAEYTEIVGYHLEQAHLYQMQVGVATGSRTELAVRAGERLAEGGRRAAGRHDFGAAVKLISRAAGLFEAGSPQRLEVLPDLGLALYEAGDYARAGEVLDEAITLAGHLGDTRTQARCRLYQETLRIHRDPQVNTEESRLVAEACIGVLSQLEDDLGLSYAWDLLAYCHDSAGRSAAALASLRRAIHHAEETGNVPRIANERRALIRSIAWGPCPAGDVVPQAKDLLHWSRAHGDRWSEARALLSLAQAHAMLGELAAARSYVASYKAVCEDVGLEFVSAYGAFESSEVELLAGNAAAAERELRAGVQFLERKGEKATLATLLALLADVLYARGRLEDAEV